MIRILIAVLSIALTLLFAGCASISPAEKFKGQTAEQIFNGGEQALTKQKYAKAVEYFEGLDTLYPFGPYAERGQLEIIYAYYKNGDYASALAAADRYIRLYPRGDHVDYAYYMRGIINYGRDENWLQKTWGSDPAERDLTYKREAFGDFQSLVTFFPESVYAPDARQRMLYIRNLIARHELDVAQFYYDRQFYVAAANRATGVVEHFQGAPAMVPALALMVRSYRELGQDALAAQALQVLSANYPDAPVIQSLQEQTTSKQRR